MSEEKKRGRPSKYTPELGDEICRRLADGETLIAICRDDAMPDERAVRYWALDLKHPFSPKYTRAREIGYQRMSDQVVEIADDCSADTYVDEKGNEQVDHENINRSRLRVDTRKWLLAKALPKIYGDKLELKHDEPANTETETQEAGTLLKLVK